MDNWMVQGVPPHCQGLRHEGFAAGTGCLLVWLVHKFTSCMSMAHTCIVPGLVSSSWQMGLFVLYNEEWYALSSFCFSYHIEIFERYLLEYCTICPFYMYMAHSCCTCNMQPLLSISWQGNVRADSCQCFSVLLDRATRWVVLWLLKPDMATTKWLEGITEVFLQHIPHC